MENKGLSRRGFLATSGMATLLAAGAPLAAQAQTSANPVRIGVIGVGGRGTALLQVMLHLPDVEVPAICDIDAEHLDRAVQIVESVLGNTPEGYQEGPYDYQRMLERDDLHAVLLTTPAEWHAEMAVDAMKAGKHVGSEVPGAKTMEECWDLVRTKEETGQRYMLLENYNYTRDRMMISNMVQEKVFGELFYAECAYIHEVNSLRFNPDGSLTWRGETMRDGFGNQYPTHSLGPVSKWMDINESDRFVSLVSMQSKSAGLKRYVKDRFGEDSPQADIVWRAGGMNVTMIQTEQDRMVTVYYDSNSPRPASIFYQLQGDQGIFDSRNGIHLAGEMDHNQWKAWTDFLEDYDHDYWRLQGEEAAQTGHGGGDYFVLSDFVEMVRKDEEPWINVYDSATWSVVTPLSQESIRNGNKSVKFPDFTENRA